MPDTPIESCDHDEREEAEQPEEAKYLHTSGHGLVQVVRDSLRPGSYAERPAGLPPFPTQTLDKAGVQGWAQLVPATLNEPQLLPPDQQNAMVEQMWALQKKMSDLDADNFDALNYRWLQQARYLKDSAMTAVDDLLRMRGLKPRLGGSGHRGRFRNDQRAETLKSCARLQSLFVNVTLEPAKPWKKKVAAVRTRVITITDVYGQMRLLDQHLDEVHKFIHRPGEKFAEFLCSSRHVALLSVKALSYDPYRQIWEKRLTRYFTWIWKIRAGSKSYLQPHRIDTLLEQIGQRIDHEHPQRTYKRLKKALDTLQADGVIVRWQINWDKHLSLGEAKVTIDPPDAVREFYSKTEDQDAEQIALSQKALEPTLGELVKIRREELGLRQIAVAKELQIAGSNLSQLENGGRVSERIRGKLEEWLSNHPKPTHVMHA